MMIDWPSLAMTFSIFLSIYYLRLNIHQVKFPLFRGNGSMVPEVRTLSIEISSSPKGPSSVNTTGGVGRPT